MSQSGISPGQILTALRLSDSQTPLITKDISNVVQQMRAEELNGRTPIEWLLEVRIRLFLANLLINTRNSKLPTSPLDTSLILGL